MISKDKSMFMWEKAQEEACDAIKDCVREAQMLGVFDYSKLIKVFADSSAHSIGSVLPQGDKLVVCCKIYDRMPAAVFHIEK